MKSYYYLFTDGSCSRKYNTIGSGFILFKKKEPNLKLENFYPLKIGGQGWKGIFKNGAAELLGIYKGLEYLLVEKLEKENIQVFSDSQYAINELTSLMRSHLQQRYVNMENSAIILRILLLLEEFPDIHFNWVRGHQKNLEDFSIFGNNEADKIAVSQHRTEDSGSKAEELSDFWDFYSKLNDENRKYDVLREVYSFYIKRFNFNIKNI